MGFIKTHVPCPVPTCKSSDACGINDDNSSFCNSCRIWTNDYDSPTIFRRDGKFVEELMTGTFSSSVQPKKPEPRVNHLKVMKSYTDLDISKASFNKLNDRGLSLDTARYYGVKSVLDEEGNPLEHWYPYYHDNEVVSYKVRKVKDKDFRWVHLKECPDKKLFGQQLLQGNGRILTITEGECDAMAVYQMQGSKYAAVSINNGMNALKDIKSNLEFIESFKEVFICFDNEPKAKEAARSIADLIPGKAKIVILPEGYKDANEMLQAGEMHLFNKAFWSAQLYTPSGVINLSNNIRKLNQRKQKESIPYPWEGLNKKLYGLRQGELVTFTGGTGLGKSSVVRELQHWLLNKTSHNIGIVALEESWERTADGILSIEANKRLYIDDIREEYGKEKYAELSNRVLGGDNQDRLWIHAHFGASNFDEILSKINFMIVGCGCRWIIVDHLQMIVAASEEKNERSLIDRIMTELRKIVEKTGAGLILVSHLRRLEGNQGHENGAQVNLSHLRGSGGIAQISDCVIALERNQQADNFDEAQKTRIRVLKSRYTGEVGIATYLQYDVKSGRLSEIHEQNTTEEFEEDFDLPF